MKPNPGKVEDLQRFQILTSKEDLQTFLGLIQYLSPFIEDLSTQAAPLRDLFKESVAFAEDTVYQRCFQHLKTLISNDAILQYYNTQKPATLMTNAS